MIDPLNLEIREWYITSPQMTNPSNIAFFFFYRILLPSPSPSTASTKNMRVNILIDGIKNTAKWLEQSRKKKNDVKNQKRRKMHNKTLVNEFVVT